MSWRRSFVLLCVSLVLGGCGDQSDLVASLKTDFVPGTDFVAVRTEVRAVGSTTMRARDAVVSTGDDFFGGVPVATFALQNGEYDVRVVLLEAGGTELIARDIRASISGDLVLTALITRSCRGVTCPLSGEDASLTQCSGRRCVAPRCVPGAPGCGEPTCTSDVDCAADTPIACVVGACIDGECLARPRDDLCSPAERCDAYRGCLLRPSTGDAGAGSACGTVDNNEDDLLPPSCLPRCLAETRAPVEACGRDLMCIATTLAGDPSPPILLQVGAELQELGCYDCYLWQQVYCVARYCPDEYDAILSCYAATPAGPCDAETAAAGACTLASSRFASCYFDHVLSCFP